MTIFKLHQNSENILSVHIDPISMAQRMPEYRPYPLVKPMEAYWKAPEISFYASQSADKNSTFPDITNWGLALLVLNAKANDVLSDLLAPSGEVLPLDYPQEDYFLFNPLYIVKEEALNRSDEVTKIDSGVNLGEENVKIIESHLEGHEIFRLPTDKCVSVYCTNQFRSRVIDSALTGLVFEEMIY